jgi:hypothetical protein
MLQLLVPVLWFGKKLINKNHRVNKTGKADFMKKSAFFWPFEIIS